MKNLEEMKELEKVTIFLNNNNLIDLKVLTNS
jgi:hypothetical protein